jgi:hypothetical protein
MNGSASLTGGVGVVTPPKESQGKRPNFPRGGSQMLELRNVSILILIKEYCETD